MDKEKKGGAVPEILCVPNEEGSPDQSKIGRTIADKEKKGGAVPEILRDPNEEGSPDRSKIGRTIADKEKKGGADSEIGSWPTTLHGSGNVSSSDRSKIGRTIVDKGKKGGADSEIGSWRTNLHASANVLSSSDRSKIGKTTVNKKISSRRKTEDSLPKSVSALSVSDESHSFLRESLEEDSEKDSRVKYLSELLRSDEACSFVQSKKSFIPQRPEKDSRGPDEGSLHSDPSQRLEKDSRDLEKDSRDPDKVSLHSDQPQRPEKSSRDPDEVSLHSEPPQRSAKDAMPKTPESSSLMTNTPKIDEAQDVFSFQRMKVSEISQLLELPMNLHSLKIEGCDVLDNIPEKVMAGIPSLQRLYIINCCSLVSFPEPADLRILHIQNCKNLKFPPHAGKTSQYAFLEHLCIGSSCDSLTSLPLDLFPKLRCLSIWDCKKLKSLSIQEGNQKDLTSLEALEIRDCPNLENFPEGGLPTPNLTSIWLSNCNLKELPHQLHTTLTSLRSIFVNNCPELVSLFKGDSASNLSLLSITSCDKLKLTREWGLHMLKCLIKLEIEGGCEDLVSFPEENLLPSNLISLRVSGLLNLKCLDYKGLQQLTTLKTLEISCCDKLESLPEGLPSSLSVLCIKECSLLKPKLQKQTGDYWPKIAHISFIETDEKVISRKSPV